MSESSLARSVNPQDEQWRHMAALDFAYMWLKGFVLSPCDLPFVFFMAIF
jgi:hypothetical protein